MAKSGFIPSKCVGQHGGNHQAKKHKRTLHRTKFYFDLADKTVLVRAKTVERATDIFRKYHGDPSEINMRKIRKEAIVCKEESKTNSWHAREKNGNIPKTNWRKDN